MQGRVRVQGDPEVHERNVRQPPRNLAHQNQIELERPIEQVLNNINQMMAIRSRIAIREEQRRSFLFEREFANHNIHFEPIGQFEELKHDNIDDYDNMM